MGVVILLKHPLTIFKGNCRCWERSATPESIYSKFDRIYTRNQKIITWVCPKHKVFQSFPNTLLQPWGSKAGVAKLAQHPLFSLNLEHRPCKSFETPELSIFKVFFYIGQPQTKRTLDTAGGWPGPLKSAMEVQNQTSTKKTNIYLFFESLGLINTCWDP